MKAIALAWMMICMPYILFGQSITGTVTDAQSQEPVDFATVYFDGTTRGTVTDQKGQFTLSTKGIELPAKLVISHLNYESNVAIIAKDDKSIGVLLTARELTIPQVEVEDLNQRAANLAEFRKIFLGDNEWGRKASIRNEDDLFFSRDYERTEVNQKRLRIDPNMLSSNLRNLEWAADSSYFSYSKAVNFQIKSRAPLEVDLPDLGYRLTVDLVKCEMDYKTGRYTYLGYFYFQPYEAEGEKPKARHRRNRQLAYFNSHQHFFRSLYQNELRQNGYQVLEKYRKPGDLVPQVYSFDIRPYLHHLEDNQLEIRDLAKKELVIFYFADNKGRPLNLNRKRNRYPVQSGLTIAADSCIIRSDGTMGDSFLYFSGFMAQKAVGALLPSDYDRTDQ